MLSPHNHKGLGDALRECQRQDRHAEQIKSATGNDGTWDGDDPDIRSNPQFWGRAGAGMLFFCPRDSTFLLCKRSAEVEQPGEWSYTGCACGGDGFYDASEGSSQSEQQLFDCAVKETREELGYFPEQYEIMDKIVYKNQKFQYTTFVAFVSVAEKRAMSANIKLNWENDEFSWKKMDSWLKMDSLHFGARYAFEKLSK